MLSDIILEIAMLSVIIRILSDTFYNFISCVPFVRASCKLLLLLILFVCIILIIIVLIFYK